MTINFISAQDFFFEVNNQILEGNYGVASEILQDNCAVLKTEIYDPKIWRCNYNLAFVYENLAFIYINGQNLAYNQELLNLAREHYIRAIEIYRLNPDDVEFSSPIFLANIEVSTGNYTGAIKIFSDLEEELSQKNLSIYNLENKSKGYQTILKVLPRLISISIENIGLLKLHPAPSKSSHNQYTLEGVLSLDKEIPFIEILPEEMFPESLGICYINFIGESQCKQIEKDQNGYFNLNEKLILEEVGDFPQDIYRAKINITPKILSKEKVMIDTPWQYEGIAYYDGGLNLEVKKNTYGKIIFYSLFLAILAILLISKIHWGFFIEIIFAVVALVLIYDFMYEFYTNFPFGIFNIHIYALGLLFIFRLFYGKPIIKLPRMKRWKIK
ncbi:MAG: hypothetical protein NUV46_00220 [Nanoarchaeota archaeon]|nr:hypothetical protein [Nanoarchaeota archaeon]